MFGDLVDVARMAPVLLPLPVRVEQRLIAKMNLWACAALINSSAAYGADDAEKLRVDRSDNVNALVSVSLKDPGSRGVKQKVRARQFAG